MSESQQAIWFFVMLLVTAASVLSFFKNVMKGHQNEIAYQEKMTKVSNLIGRLQGRLDKKEEE